MTSSNEIDRVQLVRETLVISGVVTVVCCAFAWLFADPWLGYSIAFGALLGATNFLLLARAVARMIASAAEPAHEHSEDGPLISEEGIDDADGDLQSELESASTSDPKAAHETRSEAPQNAGGPLRLAVLVLAMAMILWYMPARPEGLAVGILIVLLAAAIAGFRANQAAQAG